jgi:hypothetical protein
VGNATLKRYKGPHNPNQVVASMAGELKRYGCRSCTGDSYAAEFVTMAFRSNGIRYTKSALNKAQLYLEFLPALCSGILELLDDEVLINQLSSLERRTRSGGRDVIDHPQGGRDDVANAVSGVCAVVSKPKVYAGGGFRFGDGRVIGTTGFDSGRRLQLRQLLGCRL